MAKIVTLQLFNLFLILVVHGQEDYDTNDSSWCESSEEDYYDSYYSQYYGSFYGSYVTVYFGMYYKGYYDSDYSVPPYYFIDGLQDSRHDWVDNVGDNDIIVPDFACHSQNDNNLVSGLLREKGLNKELMDSCNGTNWQGTCYNDCVLLKLEIITSSPTIDNRINITLNTEEEIVEEWKENLLIEESDGVAERIARRIVEYCAKFVGSSIDIYLPCEAKTNLYECVQRAWQC